MSTADYVSPAWGLIGVTVGWVLNAIMDGVRRVWQRQDKTHDLSIQRGEELLQHCYEAFQWSEDARRKAFEGDVYVPIPTPIFRIAGTVELYYPALSERAQNLDGLARAYRDILVEIAGNKSRNVPMTPEVSQRLRDAVHTLHPAIGLLLTDARKAVGASIG
jgi:hypothetical protein